MLICYRPGCECSPDRNEDERMELRSIKYFLQVADEGSITRTAQKLGVTQPALIIVATERDRRRSV